MSSILFFRAALLLPIVLPLALLPFEPGFIGALLLMSLAFGGIQYIFFAAYLFYWIGRVKDPERIRRRSFVTPLIFIPVQAIGWIITGYIQKLSNQNLGGIWESLIVFSAYILLVGYAYVGIVNIMYFLIFKNHKPRIES